MGLTGCSLKAGHCVQEVEKASSIVPWNQEIPLAPRWPPPVLASCRTGALAVFTRTGVEDAAVQALGGGTGSSRRFLQPVRARVVAARAAVAIHIDFMAFHPSGGHDPPTMEPAALSSQGITLRGPLALPAANVSMAQAKPRNSS